MRKLVLGAPLREQEIPWLVQSMRKIEQASFEDIETIFDGYTIDGAFTPTRTLNPSTATASDVANVLATLITDIKQRGSSRTE